MDFVHKAVSYTEKIVRSFLRYQLSAYPFADERLHEQMRELLSVDTVRRTPLLRGPYVSLSRGPHSRGMVTRLQTAEDYPNRRQTPISPCRTRVA